MVDNGMQMNPSETFSLFIFAYDLNYNFLLGYIIYHNDNGMKQKRQKWKGRKTMKTVNKSE
jgi:hypothetical protein